MISIARLVGFLKLLLPLVLTLVLTAQAKADDRFLRLSFEIFTGSSAPDPRDIDERHVLVTTTTATLKDGSRYFFKRTIEESGHCSISYTVSEGLNEKVVEENSGRFFFDRTEHYSSRQKAKSLMFDMNGHALNCVRISASKETSAHSAPPESTKDEKLCTDHISTAIDYPSTKEAAQAKERWDDDVKSIQELCPFSRSDIDPLK